MESSSNVRYSTGMVIKHRWVYYDCPRVVEMKVSGTQRHPNRLFLTCRDGGCRFFKCANQEMITMKTCLLMKVAVMWWMMDWLKEVLQLIYARDVELNPNLGKGIRDWCFFFSFNDDKLLK